MAILTARFEADLSDVGDDPGDWTDPQVTLSFFDNVGYTSDSGRFYSDFVRASFADEPDYRNQWLGSGLVFDAVNGRLTAGTVTGFVQEERVNGVWQETFSVESFSVDAVQLSNAMNSPTGDLVQALIETIFSGDDTFNLSPEADNVDAFGGNDVVNGGAGNDVVNGGAGNDNLRGGAGNDRLSGGQGNDSLLGSSGNDMLDGGSGVDRMTGGLGNDTYVIDDTRDGVVEAAAGGIDTVRIGRDYTLLANFENLVLTGSGANDGAGNSAGNRITGNAAVNRLSGGGGNDALTGGAGNDVVLGGSGNDALAGGFGNDMLTGGSGRDAFLFDRALNATTNVDRIADFIAVDDRLLLDDAVFDGIGPLGALAAGAFRAGVSARDASDRIVYDATAGRLWFDADGNGAGAATLFATMAPGTALTVGDIFVV